MSQETIKETFQVPSPARLDVTNIRGTIAIQPGEANVIQITAIKHLNTGDSERTQIELSQGEDGQVSARTYIPNQGRKHFNHKPNEVDYHILVPQTCEVAVSCVSSSASLVGLEGSFDLNSVSGNLDLESLIGDVVINSVSGDVHAGKVNGGLRIKTVSGDISFSESQLSSIEGSTVSGDIALHTPIKADTIHLKSVSGNVSLVLPEEQGLSIQTKSMSGRFSTSLPITSEKRTGRSHAADLAGGGPGIMHKSMSGNLWVGTEAALEAGHEDQDTPSEKRVPMDILERIDRGELTVEEGLAAINH